MKKLVFVLVAVYCLLIIAPVNAYVGAGAGFQDIKGSFAEQAITNMNRQGIIHGVNTAQFAPQKNVTRIQFVILMAKALGIQPYIPSEPSFSDVPLGSLPAGYVEALVNLGLINGMGNGTFKGDNPIRRQDVAVIISKAFADQSVLPEGKKYVDAGQISTHAINGVTYVTAKGWMNGSKGYFYPLRNLTRAEAAVIVDRVWQTRRDQGMKALPQFPDPLEIKAGEMTEIEMPGGQYPIGFAPVYGSDKPELFSVYPDGMLVAGKQSGAGTLTVNSGANSYPINVKISDTKGMQEASVEPGGESATPQRAYNYDIIAHSPDAGFKNTELSMKPGPVDGLFSRSDTWTGFLRQRGRDIIVDLGTIGTVNGISIEFRQDVDAGVLLPEYLRGAVSTDGVSWYELGRAYCGTALSGEKVQEVKLALTFPAVHTRYIKLSFPVDVWVFARHLTVQTGAIAEKPVVLAPIPAEQYSTGTYLQDPDIGDILLVYTGTQGNAQNLTVNNFLPLVAYTDIQGQIKGRMFDTMLFLPYNSVPCTKDGWQGYLDDLFASGEQLNALETTMERVYQLTGQPTKEKVILTIPYPDSNQSNFSGVSFSETSASRDIAAKNRLEAVRWYYGELMKKWDGAGFKNLELAGIYWNQEMVDKSVYGEEELIQNVANMVGEKGLKFFWIPYYGAQGYEKWESYGFTHVFIQPNYYATGALREDRMERTAALAGQYRTGIEIELDARVFTDPYYRNLFYQELSQGHQLGLDRNTVNAYYVGQPSTLLDAARSGYPDQRQIYDDLYKWIKDEYDG